MSALLVAEGIEKSFGATRVLRGVTLAVGAGEIVGLFGPNGSGKTTLANIVSGLVRPDRGRIVFEGKDVTRLPMDARFRLGIARTFQIPGPYPSLTVTESVRVALLCGAPASGRQPPSVRSYRLRRSPRERSSSGSGAQGREGTSIPPAGLEEELSAILERTGLTAQRFWPAAKLSQGCLRRLEFARAISCRPRFVLLDEIFSALSARDAAELASLLRSLNRESGTSFVLISHNPLILEEMCCRVVAVDDGRVTWEGKPAELAKYVPAAASHDHGHAS